MRNLKIECRLSKFDIIVENESSPDEPYLWAFYIRIDGRNINVFKPEESFVTLHNAAGSHGNLGPASDDVEKEDAPLTIPSKIGKWNTELDTMGTLFPQLVPYCMVAILVIAIEEDAAPSTSKMEEARKKLKSNLQSQLNAALIKVIKDQKIDLKNLEASISYDKLMNGITGILAGDIIANAIAGLLINPLFFLGTDADDFIGYDIAGPYMIGEILSSATEKIDFNLYLAQNGANFDGKYKVSGYIKITDPVQYANAAVVQYSNSISVIGRAANVDKYFRSYSENSGSSWSGFKKIGEGEFISSPAAALSADGKKLHVVGLGKDKKFWRAYSPDGGKNWNIAWTPILNGLFTSSPSLSISADGNKIYLIGKGNDNKAWFGFSKNGGSNWTGFSPIGAGVFLSGLCTCCSADGNQIFVFGLGKDRKIWQASSNNGGASWYLAWKPLTSGQFYSSPSAVCTPDGKRVAVFARDKNNRFAACYSANYGQNWSMWNQFDNGSFISSPSSSIAPDGKKITLVGIGNNMNLYFLKSSNFGLTWSSKWTRINNTDTFC
ncbi:uncharacterized protein with PIN domain [Algoriphagus iocasae]|jgi:uncharacterized protein with PIN domain|uniref:Uncharacterized protein with PIN domain n=1 Tax=Algoriphagus iocasae TaxID=1836499 RepID=A0A841MA45_9BACT|nr:glycoside hydrolase [Algoriphagus iocasae]MBB6324812.1 uncharacterized protein with PIN domain [Algoriphagus iocasae]